MRALFAFAIFISLVAINAQNVTLKNNCTDFIYIRCFTAKSSMQCPTAFNQALPAGASISFDLGESEWTGSFLMIDWDFNAANSVDFDLKYLNVGNLYDANGQHGNLAVKVVPSDPSCPAAACGVDNNHGCITGSYSPLNMQKCGLKSNFTATWCADGVESMEEATKLFLF